MKGRTPVLLYWQRFRARCCDRISLLVFDVLRACKPVLAFGRWVFVVRHADIVDVLGRDKDFSVALYDVNMRSATVRFLLGKERSPEYDSERSAIESALAPEDTERIQKIAADVAQELIGAANGPVGLNVADFAKRGLVRVVDRYFGIPPTPGDEIAFVRLFETSSYYLFSPSVVVPPELRVSGVRASRTIAEHIASLVSKRRASSKAEQDDVLGRLLALVGSESLQNFDDDDVVRTITGTASGTLVPTMRLWIDAVDRLMELPPAELAKLQRIALESLSGATEGDTDLRVSLDRQIWKYLREAARFKPFPGFLIRYCEHDTVVGAATSRGRTIKQGSMVISCMRSAAFDRRAVSRPYQFRADRPDDDYLLFGTGQHACLGASRERPIAQTIMVEFTKALFSQGCLRRAPGTRGYIGMGDRRLIPDRYSPKTFIVQFDL